MASTTTKATRPKTAVADPFAAATREVSLPRLKKPPKKAKMTRVGIVPDDVATLSEDGAARFAELRTDLRLPPNAGETDLSVTFHGGAIASGVAVELIFWGSAWQQPANSVLRAQFVASAAALIGGPYYTALKEYGAAKPTFRGAVTVISPNPSNSFDDGDVGDLVWNCIDANIFPEPDDPGGRIFYCVVMPPGTSYGPGGALGAHSWPHDYDFPFDWDTAWVAWVGFGSINTLTRVLGHELAEAATDPEGDGWHTDQSGEEIGDICNTRQGFVNGVWVEGYWSRRMNACVIPQSTDTPVSGVARMSDQLDLFITGNDGRVYTSWWHESSDWSGVNNNWRPIGGFFPVAGPVSSVARESSQLDCFITGNDGRVYTSWWHEGHDWSGVNNNWRAIGGFFPAGAPVVAVARMSDQLDLFITGNDGRVYTSWWHEGHDWSGVNNNWRPIGGFFPIGAPISAIARATDQLDLFVVGNDGRVYTSWWHEGYDWSGLNNNWRAIGGFFPAGASVTAVARMSDQLDLFVTGWDGRVYTSWWHEGSDWSGINNNWRPIGGFFPIAAPVSSVARESGQLDCFVTGNDGRVYTSWWHEGSDWSGMNNNWRAIGGFFPAAAPVGALARMSDQLDLFITGNDGRVYTSWWHEGSDWSGINNNWRPIGGFFPVGI
jgi:hypothetical protein